MLSGDGDHPMTRLSDTQLVILTAAAQRSDGAVLPLPETLRIKGGALTKVMDSLRNKGLIRVVETDGRPHRVVLTSQGMAAIGVEREDDAGSDQTGAASADTGATAANTAPTPADAGAQATDAAAPATGADAAATPARGKAKAKAARAKSTKARKAAAADKPTPRAGTKQAQMIEMLKRPEGATVEQIAAATGWQHHTIRGAISGALKKKLGLNVEATRTREVGPNKTGAKGSSTVYRITG